MSIIVSGFWDGGQFILAERGYHRKTSQPCVDEDLRCEISPSVQRLSDLFVADKPHELIIACISF